jgi:hypothetical protein
MMLKKRQTKIMLSDGNIKSEEKYKKKETANSMREL